MGLEDRDELRSEILGLLEAERQEELALRLEEAHAEDIASILRELTVEERTRVFRLLAQEQAGAVLHEMDDQTLVELVRALDEDELTEILDRMRPDDAAQVVGELPEAEAEKLLDLMEAEEAENVQELLRHGEKTAGRIMTPEFLAVHEETSVGQALEYLRKSADAESVFYLYVVDDHNHLIGVVPLRRLITADPGTPIRLICQREVVSVTPDTDQEEVARLVTKHNLLSVPVVSRGNALVGTITVDDVIDVIHEEATEDIQRLAGAGGDESVFDPPRTVFTKRLVWRLVNLGTAILAATVIGLFEDSIQSLALLAVFMPIVASMGGIGTTQTATVVIRGLALGDMTRAHVWRVLRKELQLGLTTGLTVGLAMVTIAYLWKGKLLLSLILGIALLGNMLVAAAVGVLIPITLKIFRVDPAIASSVIITTFTDVFGFFSFLGLATLLLHFLAR